MLVAEEATQGEAAVGVGPQGAQPLDPGRQFVGHGLDLLHFIRMLLFDVLSPSYFLAEGWCKLLHVVTVFVYGLFKGLYGFC